MVEKDEDMKPTLPRAVLLHVCVCVATDPEPLLTLDARMRSLAALAGTDRELRRDVYAVAIPQIVERFVPVAEARRHSRRVRPTLESLARETDGRVAAIAGVSTGLCCRLSSGDERRALGDLTNLPQERKTAGWRAEMVDGILEVSASDARWALVPVKREMCRRAALRIAAGEARRRYRLSERDMEELARAGRPPYALDEVYRVALARHGSTRALERREEAIRETSRKRAETMNAAAERKREENRAAALQKFRGVMQEVANRHRRTIVEFNRRWGVVVETWPHNWPYRIAWIDGPIRRFLAVEGFDDGGQQEQQQQLLRDRDAWFACVGCAIAHNSTLTSALNPRYISQATLDAALTALPHAPMDPRVAVEMCVRFLRDEVATMAYRSVTTVAMNPAFSSHTTIRPDAAVIIPMLAEHAIREQPTRAEAVYAVAIKMFTPNSF